MPIDRTQVKNSLAGGDRSQMEHIDRDAVKAALSRRGKFDPKADAAVENTPEKILGSDFDAESFAPTDLRFDLSRGDTFEEKELRLKRRFGKGAELREISKSLLLGGPDVPTLVYRENPHEKFRMVNPKGFERGDVVEALGPSFEAIMGEGALAAAGKLLGSGKASVAKVVLFQAFGAFLGEGAEQAIQSMNDVQLQGLVDQLKEASAEGGLSAAGGFIVSPLVGARNALTGRGILDIGDEGIASLQSAARLSDEIGEEIRLTPGGVGSQPIVARQEAQAATLVTAFRDRYTQIVKQLDAAVEKAKPVDVVHSGTVERTLTRLKEFGQQFVNRLGVRNVSKTAGGKALQQGRKEFDTVSHAVTNRLYQAAEDIAEPAFNLEPLGMVSAGLRAGAKGKLGSNIEVLLKDLEKISGPKTLPDGSVISVTQQLRNVRTSAFDAARNATAPGQIDSVVSGQATSLGVEITRVLDNPINPDPVFKRAYKTASDSSKYRHSVMDADAMIQVGKSQEPSGLLQYARPGNSEALRLFKNAVDPQVYTRFQHAAQTELLSDFSNLSRRLDAFNADRETLDLIIPPNQQSAWRSVAKEAERINAVGADKIALRQVGNKEFVRGIVDQGDPNTFFTIARAINQSNDVQLRNSMRSGIIDYAWDGAIKFEKNGLRINRGQVAKAIKELEKSNMLRFLNKGQRAMLEDVDKVAASLERIADAGVSIRAMEISSQLPGDIATLNFTGPAVRGFLQSYGVSKLYLSPLGERFLIGTGKKNSKGRFLRLLGASMTRVVLDEDLKLALEERALDLSEETE